MIVERFITPGLAQVAYIVADPARREAAVIDPRRDIDDYLAWAADHGYDIVAILETHVHADFVSGARELAAATGALVYAGELGKTRFAHQPLSDGDIIPVGDLRLQALWTPGHTPEHLAYLLFDPPQGDAPLALFSGDVLFPGEVGRPDLLGPDQTNTLIDQLHETVSQRLSNLPDGLVVYPGHGAGSPCGKQIGDAAQTTVGQEKRFNYAFQTGSREAFWRAVMDDMPRSPVYYPILKQVNKRGPALLSDLPSGEPLTAEDVAARMEAGALLLDARPAHDFAAGHIPGSVNVGRDGSFAIWTGWLTPYDREVVLVLPSDSDYASTRLELRRIGVDEIAGYLGGGIDAWRDSGRQIALLAELSVNELAAASEQGDAVTILDVRDAAEWAGGHIPGARHLFAGDIAQGAVPELVHGARLAVICGSGYRAAVAASLLELQGFHDVATVPGGMTAWATAGQLIDA